MKGRTLSLIHRVDVEALLKKVCDHDWGVAERCNMQHVLAMVVSRMDICAIFYQQMNHIGVAFDSSVM